MSEAQLIRAVFLATLPILVCALGMLGGIVWNLIDVKGLRTQVNALTTKVGELAERVSHIEGKIEDRKVVLEPR